MASQSKNVYIHLIKVEHSTSTCHIVDTGYKVIQYFIGKLLDMVKMRQEG